MSKRRSNGEGTPVTLPNGKKQHRISYTRPDGSTGRKSFTAPTSRQALARARAWQREQAAGRSDDSRITVAQYAARWLRERAPNRGIAWTIKNYELGLNRLLPEIGGVAIADLSPAHIQAALTRCTADGYAASTIRQSRKVLSTMLNDARRDRLIAVNPVPDTTPPRLPQRAAPPTFRPEEVAFFLRHGETEGDPDWPLWAMLLTTGLRIGEALGLRWAEVDERAGTVAVTGQVVRHSGTAERVSRTKSESSRRVIPIGPTARRALTAQRGQTGSGELVFVSGDGRPVNSVTTRRRFYAALERVGLARRRPHGGRHTTATILISEGYPLRVVADILGHSSVKTTGDVYAHLEPGTLATAVAGLERAIFAESEGGTVASTVAWGAKEG